MVRIVLEGLGDHLWVADLQDPYFDVLSSLTCCMLRSWSSTTALVFLSSGASTAIRILRGPVGVRWTVGVSLVGWWNVIIGGSVASRRLSGRWSVLKERPSSSGSSTSK